MFTVTSGQWVVWMVNNSWVGHVQNIQNLSCQAAVKEKNWVYKKLIEAVVLEIGDLMKFVYLKSYLKIRAVMVIDGSWCVSWNLLPLRTWTQDHKMFEHVVHRTMESSKALDDCNSIHQTWSSPRLTATGKNDNKKSGSQKLGIFQCINPSFLFQYLYLTFVSTIKGQSYSGYLYMDIVTPMNRDESKEEV